MWLFPLAFNVAYKGLSIKKYYDDMDSKVEKVVLTPSTENPPS